MNKTVEKYLYILIEIAVVAAFITFLIFNWDKTIQFFCPIMQKVYTTKLAYISILFFTAGQIGGYALCSFIKTNLEELCNAYQKRQENISIQKDDYNAKVEVLEAKIKTLEAALESALKNK